MEVLCEAFHSAIYTCCKDAKGDCCWQVDELKQHIKILQAVGYNAMEGEDVSPRRDNSAGAEGTSMRSLEALLLAKNRHLEHELTMARLQIADLTGVPWRSPISLETIRNDTLSTLTPFTIHVVTSFFS